MKSAYRLAVQLDNRDSGSSSNLVEEKSLWRSIWRMDCQLRMKISVWRAIKDVLPTTEKIKAKGISTNDCCFLCRPKLEDRVHTFWKCKISLCRDWWIPKDYWAEAIKILNKNEINMAGQIIWAIWKVRNQSKHSCTQKSPIQIIRDISNTIDTIKRKE